MKGAFVGKNNSDIVLIVTMSLATIGLLIPLHVNKLYHSCTYNFLPEDEHSDSKHVEDIVEIKILV